jgi:hypothetical protein
MDILVPFVFLNDCNDLGGILECLERAIIWLAIHGSGLGIGIQQEF